MNTPLLTIGVLGWFIILLILLRALDIMCIVRGMTTLFPEGYKPWYPIAWYTLLLAFSLLAIYNPLTW